MDGENLGTGTEGLAAPENVPEGGEGAAQTGEVAKGAQEGGKVVPEKYEFHVAEGLTLDDKMQADFTAVAKELKLSQEEADKLIGLHGNILMDMVKQHDAQLEEWSSKCHELGLDKEEAMADANYCLKQLGGDEAAKVLEETGAIYHPAVLKMLQFVGNAIREDKGADGSAGAAQTTRVSDLIFAKSKK